MNLGYYAHHQGSGHCQKARRIATWLSSTKAQLTVMTSAKNASKWLGDRANVNLIQLADEDPTPRDVYANQHDPTKPNYVHYNPVGNRDIQTRSFQILSVVQHKRLEVVIVDLSVEVATLCRVASVPYLYVRLPGNRNDTPHLEAFLGAQALLAFFPPELENDTTPNWVKQKTIYLGFVLPETGVSTHHTPSERTALRQYVHCPPSKWMITTVSGYGGNQALSKAFIEIRQKLDSNADTANKLWWVWLGATPDNAVTMTDNIQPDWQGEVTDVASFMAFSDWVITAAGMTTVAEMQRHPNTPWTIIAEPRHFAEQADTAEQLVQGGFAMNVEQTLEQLPLMADKPQTYLPRPLLSSINCTPPSDFFAAMAYASSVQDWARNVLPSFIHT